MFLIQNLKKTMVLKHFELKLVQSSKILPKCTEVS